MLGPGRNHYTESNATLSTTKVGNHFYILLNLAFIQNELLIYVVRKSSIF